MTFPTEQQVYHRLRWDARFDVERCHVVITLRPSGTKRLPYLEYDPRRVPFHRIVEFWVDDELAWSRPDRIDRLDAIAARQLPPDVGRALPEIPLAPHRFAGTRWVPGTLDPVAMPARLRVVTWNLLFDHHLGTASAAWLRSEQRWADALDRLAREDADVIALVEITPVIWARILAAPWVQRYAISHAPDARLLVPYGQVVLSRVPIVRAGAIQLVRDKRAVVVDVRAGDRTFGVAALHLTSNRTEGAPALRSAQLAAILGHVRATPRDAWLVAGDFNANPSEHGAQLAAAGAVDAWESSRPDQPGATFDVAANPLAAAMSVTGKSGRYDRIVAIAGATRLVPIDARLLGQEPGAYGLPPSDHYAVCADLEVAAAATELATAVPSKQTALVLVPPLSAWGPLQRVRCLHDRGFGRWPPHLTLFYPFVEPRLVDEAARAVDELCAAIEPFELALEDVGPIEPGSRIVVLSPTRHTARWIDQLHARLVERFPSLAGKRRFRPHLTLARDPDAPLPRAIPTRWRVEHVTLLREHERRLVPVHESRLAGVGRAPARPAVPDPAAPIIARVRDALGELAVVADVAPFGSAVYAPEQARDVDLLVRVADPAIASVLADRLALRLVGHTLRGTLDGTFVDVVVTADDDPAPADARALVAHLHDHGRHDAFAHAWPYVQRFSRSRALVGNASGFLPGLGWALLLAIPLVHDERVCAATGDAIVPAWLDWLGGLRPGARLSLDARARPRDDTALWLAAPSPPSRDVARSLTPGTARVLFAEFARAAGRDPDRAATDLLDEPPAGTTLIVEGTGDAARGRYEGMLRDLVLALEARVVVRPWGRIVDLNQRWQHRFTVDDVTTAIEITEAALARCFDPETRPALHAWR